ncbi:DUF1983 domain-containing protein [Pseudomonas salomonii]|uniref:DUF1983 domain-containing protein n=1 Tax=Pseudomonas salomonii TaxID=191391 RepID=A0ABS9GPR7_9PSED|nr:DUF1983 domain-containing protein [Pseudomonas salomonii]MCF5546171.1 DUF1983 domain-containing protein [Pseudomonas salomonii]
MGAARKIDIHGAKGGEEKPKTPTEAPDSLRSVAIAKMLIAIGEGEFEGTPTAKDIYLDNTPLQDPQGNMNFPNVKWEWRTGAVDQTYIQGIPSIENETTIGTELRSGTPWVRAISNTQLSAVRVRFGWPALQSVDARNNINGYRIEYKVELATDGGAYQQVLSEAVDGKTTSLYECTRRIDLPKANTGWLMRITRLTANKNSPAKFSDTMQIAGFTEVIDAKIRYPNTALLYIEFSAEQFRSIPAVTVGCKARKWSVPSNYDPASRTYSGVWDGTFKEAYTNNPTWATHGITTIDRFGLGRRIKPWMVDKWELYRISQYCDQLVPDGKGGQEPRFICNLNLQSKADAWSLLRDISAIYRGMTYWAQGQVFTLSDMPRATDFDFAYTRANVIDGKFTYSSASERTRYTRALISYDNPLNNYDTDVTAVTDQKLQRRYGDNPLEISAIGCTRESEAQRRGKWALLTNSKDRAVTFKVGLDGRIPLPGYVIPIADELLAGRPVGGRISAVNGKVITLDRDTQAKPGDRLILNLPDGKCEGRTVQLVTGRKVTVTVAYSVTPEPELVWALDADDLAIPLYRVVSVARPEPGVFEISAVQYDPSKFAHIDTGARLEERPISVIPITVVPAPASVMLTSSYAVNQGIAISTMNISWPAVAGAVAYDVEWRKDSGNWIKVQRTGSTSVDVTGIYSGAYLARVRSVSAFEISSIWKSSNLTNLEGKVGLPPAVSFLTTTSLVYGIGIQWGFPLGAEDTQRTEIWYSQSADLTKAAKLSDFSYPQASHEMHGLLAGASLFFWARLVDRSGNVGPFYPVSEMVNGRASSEQTEYEKYFADKIGKGALYQSLREEIDLISGDGPGSVNERLEEAKQELEDLISKVNDALVYDSAKIYAKGEIVRKDQHLYQAIATVPLNVSPPNSAYWTDIGTFLETANALASQVRIIENTIQEINGKITASATSLEALRSAARGDDGTGELAGALKAWSSTASLAVERKSRASESEAFAQQITGLNAQVGDSKASLTTLEQVVATNREMTATQVTQLQSDLAKTNSNLDGNASLLNSLDTKVASLDGKVTAQATSTESLRASVRGDDGAGDLAGAIGAWKSLASYGSQVRVFANQALATAEKQASLQAGVDDAKGLIQAQEKVTASAIDVQAKRTDTVQASLGKTNSSVQTVSEALTTLDGKVSAQTTIKAQTISNGKRVMAGLALGSDGNTSEILAFAQRFAIVDEVSGNLILPFVVQDGQVFINQAVINTAFIQNIVLGMTLKSEALDSQGRPLLEINVKAGTFTLRSAGTGGSALLNNEGLAVFDAGGILRTMLGKTS